MKRAMGHGDRAVTAQLEEVANAMAQSAGMCTSAVRTFIEAFLDLQKGIADFKSEANKLGVFFDDGKRHPSGLCPGEGDACQWARSIQEKVRGAR